MAAATGDVFPPRRHRPGGRLVLAAMAAVVASVTLAACGGGGSAYKVTAVLPSAEGLFAGNSVEILGVAGGTVTSVQPVGNEVVVTMSVNGERLPADVHAALVTPQLLGEPSIELSPGYTGGSQLQPDATIPESRTSVPVSIDQLLRDLQQYLGEVNDKSVSDLVTNLSQDLSGQGQALNQLIANGAGTLSLLAQKGNSLGQLNGSLAAITGTLRQRTATVAQLLQSYDTVAGVIADNSGPLGDSITQLADASQELSQLLAPDLQPLQTDIASVTQVGRTLDRNLSSLDEGLSSSVALFAAAKHAYDPVNNWLNLNDQLAPGVTANVVAGLVRDRLAGICRRVLANHGAGLSASAISTLQTCGNPDSGFFDPLLGLIPTILNSATGSTTPSSASAQQMLSKGLAEIPGLSSSQSASISQVPPSSLATPSAGSSGSSSSILGGGPVLPEAPRPSSAQSSGASSGSGLLGGLLHGLLGVAHFFGSLL